MAAVDPGRDFAAGMVETTQNEAEYDKHEKDNHSVVQAESLHDGIHDGLTFPTDDEVHTLRRVPDSIPWNTYLIAVVEMAERFSYYGCVIVFQNFIQHPLPAGSKTGASHDPNTSAGALGRKQQTATGLTTFNSFWVYVIPLFGAYLADTRWGRFKTICIAVGIAIFGHILLVISSIPPLLAHPNGALGLFVVAIIIMGLGTGGFKANISPLVAEQYKRTKMFVATTKSGERVIVDPALTTTRIYMYFYLFINIGALVGQIGMVYAEKNVGYWLAYLLPTVVFCMTPLVLWFGRNRYVRSPPSGSVLVSAIRIWRYAARGRWSANPTTLIRNFQSETFYDQAKPSNVVAAGHEKPRWMTFDDRWVDEVRRGIKACIVFLWIPLYWLTYNQLNNNLVSQAATMTTNGLPNDLLNNLDPLALIILIPIMDLVVYPLLRRRNIRFTALKRICLGFFLGSASMIWAAVVQAYIYKTNPCGRYAATCMENGIARVSPLNVWIQSGSYILTAISEIFASITGLEYAFTKAPKNMRSLVMAVFLFMSAIASAIGEAFVPLSTDPLLVWNYGVMAVLAFVAGCLFWICHRHLDADEEHLNNLATGEFNGQVVVPTEKPHGGA